MCENRPRPLRITLLTGRKKMPNRDRAIKKSIANLPYARYRR
jgi:hypothetical protein